MENLRFELTVEEANLILAGIAKLPYEAAAPLIDKIRTQASQQLKPNIPSSDDDVKE